MMPGTAGSLVRARARIAACIALAAFATLMPLELSAQRATDRAAVSRGGSVSAHATRQAAATESYEVSGVRVIHRRGTANDVVAANLYLLGGTRLTTPASDGLEPFLLAASERGTDNYPREAVRRALAEQGTSIGVGAESDWTLFAARATVPTFEATFEVLADRVMNPTLESREVEMVRDLMLSAVRQRRDSPDALLEYLADSVAFEGHYYGRSPHGNEHSLASISVSDLQQFHEQHMVKSRMLLVIVGNVERSTVEQIVARTLGTLPQGSYTWTTPERPTQAASRLVVEPRQLPTNYILGYYTGPAANSADYPAMRLATAILAGRLFHEVRVRRNLTYAVDAPLVDRAWAAGGLYVTTVSPDTVLALMRLGIEELQTGMIDANGLAQLVQGFIVQYFMDNETNADQADFLARAQVYRGDWRVADGFVAELESVTPMDIQRVSRDYMRDIRFAYLGDPRRVTPGLARIF